MEYYNYDITLKHNGYTPIDNYTECYIFNGETTLCTWNWDKEKNEFKVVLNRTDFNSTSFERFQKYKIGRNDIFGAIRCKLHDHQMMRHVKFDLPFVSYRDQTTAVPEEIQPEEKVFNPFLFSITTFLSVVMVMTLVYNWLRRKQRLAEMKDKITR